MRPHSHTGQVKHIHIALIPRQVIVVDRAHNGGHGLTYALAVVTKFPVNVAVKQPRGDLVAARQGK